MTRKIPLKLILEFGLFVLLFVIASFLAQRYVDRLSAALDVGPLGMVLYAVVTILSVVIAPVSTLPLVPIASNLWGWGTCGFLNIASWTTGGYIAFQLGRRYGAPVIGRLVPMERVHRMERHIPKGEAFWTIVVLRIGMPVDLLSYALGIFSEIDTRRYLLVTILGVSPMAFVLAYLGTVSLSLQLLIIALAAAIVSIIWFASARREQPPNGTEY